MSEHVAIVAGKVGPSEVLVNTVGMFHPGLEPTAGMATAAVSKAALSM